MPLEAIIMLPLVFRKFIFPREAAEAKPTEALIMKTPSFL